MILKMLKRYEIFIDIFGYTIHFFFSEKINFLIRFYHLNAFICINLYNEISPIKF